MPIACMTRATPGGRPDGSGGGGGGGPSDGGASLAVRELRSAKRCASSSADGPPVPVTSEHISSNPASTKCSASCTPPLLSTRRPAASTARRMMPDAQMSLKTPRSSRRRYMRRASPRSSSNSARCLIGYLRSDTGDVGVDGVVVTGGAGDRQPDRPQQRVGQLERVAPGNVEAVEQPAADEVEVRRHRRADVASGRAQLGEGLARVAVGVEQRARRRVVP